MNWAIISEHQGMVLPPANNNIIGIPWSFLALQWRVQFPAFKSALQCIVQFSTSVHPALMCISDCSMLAFYTYSAVYTINIHNLIHKYAQIHNIHIKQLNTIYTYFTQYIVYTQYAWCGRQRLWAVRVDLVGIEISAGTNFMMICNTGDFALSSNNWYNPRGRLGGPSHMAATDDDDHLIFLYRVLESFHFYPAWLQIKHMHNKQLIQPSTTSLVQTIWTP